jgi:hypothetical protein
MRIFKVFVSVSMLLIGPYGLAQSLQIAIPTNPTGKPASKIKKGENLNSTSDSREQFIIVIPKDNSDIKKTGTLVVDDEDKTPRIKIPENKNEFLNCQRSNDGRFIDCPDGQFVKTNSVVDTMRNKTIDKAEVAKPSDDSSKTSVSK